MVDWTSDVRSSGVSRGDGERRYSVVAVIRAEQSPVQGFEFFIAQFLFQELQELFFLSRANVIEVVNGFGFLEFGKVFFVISEAGVVENDHFDRVAVGPKMFVVSLDRFRNVT